MGYLKKDMKASYQRTLYFSQDFLLWSMIAAIETFGYISICKRLSLRRCINQCHSCVNAVPQPYSQWIPNKHRSHDVNKGERQDRNIYKMEMTPTKRILLVTCQN